MMTIFAWLFVGHLVGDFLLQTTWMAENKDKSWFPLLVHSSVYTLAVSLLAMPAGGLSAAGIALIFLAHIFLDRRIFIEFWAKKITGSDTIVWLKIMLDQTWHIIVLAIAIML